MWQKSSARSCCGGPASAAAIKPERSSITPSAGPVKFLLSRVRTLCLNRSVCPVCLHSPIPCGSNCARCLSQRSPGEVVRQSSGAGAWRLCCGSHVQPRLGVNCPRTSGHGKPWCTIIGAGVKKGSGSGFSRSSSLRTRLLRLASLFPLPDGLSGAVVLRENEDMQHHDHYFTF